MARTYSFDQFEMTFAGLDLKGGAASADAVLTETMNSPGTTSTPGGSGRVTYSHQPDRSGSLTLVVDTSSDLHKQLRAIYKQHEISKNQFYPFLALDFSSGEVFTWTNSVISEEPGETRGITSSTATWTWLFEDRTKTTPTGQNAVGG